MKNRIYLPLLILTFFVASCTLPSKEEEISTGDALRTAAAQTVSAQLTADGANSAPDTNTPQPTETTAVQPTATNTAATNTATTVVGSGVTATTAAQQKCDSAAYVADITVNDGDQFAPGETFTKTWQIKNTGTCTWSTSYKLIYAADVSGTAAIGEPSAVSLKNSVPPGGTTQVSVELTAPTTPGTYRSDWRMQNASGISFAVDASTIWLVIEVTGSTAGSATPTATWDPSKPTYTPDPSLPTATAGATATPSVISASGGINVLQTESMDLDTGHIITTGADILFEYVNDSNKFLAPQNGATLAYWGGSAPTHSDCAAASLSTGKLQVLDSSTGGYYCYKTEVGRFGFLVLNSLTPSDITQPQTLNIGYNTWNK